MAISQPKEEFQLVQRAKEGDIHAFRQLVDMHKDVLLSLVCSILKDPKLGEDVLQEVFIKVYRSLKKFRGKSSFRTWVYRIAINASYNALKKQQRQNKLKESVINQVEVSVSPKDLVKEEEQKRYIQLALDQLKTDEALVLRLYYLCELSIGEIEKATGFKKAKIKTDLHRGRTNFESALKHLLKGEINQLL